MAIAFVAATEYHNPSLLAQHVITLPACSVGDLIIVHISKNGNTTETTPEPMPAGWTRIGLWHTGFATKGAEAIYYRIKESGDPSTVTHTYPEFGELSLTANCVAYSGTATNFPIDSFSTWNNGTSTAPLSPAITTTTTNTMVIRIMSHDDSANTDVIEGNCFPAGVTNRAFQEVLDGGGNEGYIAFGEDGIQASAGTTGTATWTSENADGWGARTFAIRDAANDPVTVTKDFTFDSTFANVFLKDTNFDAVLQGVFTKDVTFDAILQFIATGDIQMDAVLKKEGLQKDFTFDADLRILVANTLTCQYDMVSFIANTLSNLYDIRNLVNNENTFIYGLGGLVANTLTVLSDIHVLISNTLTSIQSTLDYVSNTLTGRWNITQFISNTLTSIQSTLDYVSNTSTLKYNILNHISNTGTFLYDILPKFTKIQLKNARRKIKLFR